MNIVNLTPHQLTIYDTSKCDATATIVSPSGTVTRCAVKRSPLKSMFKFQINKSEFGEVHDLPEPKEDTIYVVSALVVSALNGTRQDVYCPGEAVRDDSGRIIGCVGLSQ